MARPSNINHRYSIICKVTGEKIATNPRQFIALMKRYSLGPVEMENSYVGREGRQQIAKEGLTTEQAVEKYKLHINVASKLQCINKKARKPSVPKTIDEALSPVTSAGIAVESQEPIIEKTASSYSRSIRAEDTDEAVIA